MIAIGRTHWAIPEGFIPSESPPGAGRPLLSHEAACKGHRKLSGEFPQSLRLPSGAGSGGSPY